jgi:hypothetical protein
LKLADNATITAVHKATRADIKEGDYIGSGAMPQADGSQKALEVHIFAASMRGQGDGHRPWNGSPDSTMTNGAVGNIVSGVDGQIVLVKYKDGEKKIIVGPDTPVVRYEVGSMDDIRPALPSAWSLRPNRPTARLPPRASMWVVAAARPIDARSDGGYRAPAASKMRTISP